MKKLFLILAFLTIGNLFGQGYVKPVGKLTQEQVEDYAFDNARWGAGVRTLISTVYDDVNNQVDFIVENDLSQYDNSTSNFSTTTGDVTLGGNNTFTGTSNRFDFGSGYVTFNGTASGSTGVRFQRSGTERLLMTALNSGPPFFQILANDGLWLHSTNSTSGIKINNAWSGLSGATIDSFGNDDSFVTIDWINLQNFGTGRLDTSSTITTSRDALLTDLDGINISTSTTDVTITIDSDMTGAFATGDLLLYQRQGTGNITIAYNGTYAAQGSDTPTTFEDNQAITMRYEGGNDWSVINAPQNAFATATATGTEVDMSGITQNNFSAASSATPFTMVKIAVGGYAEVLINKSGSAPLVTNATQLPNTATFIASTDMVLCIKDFDGTQKYWFVEF